MQTGAFTAVAGNGYPVNTTAAQITMTLSLSPSVGDTIEFVDYAGTFNSNQLMIARNGSNIKGAAADVSSTGQRVGVRMVYVDATQGWIAATARTATALGSFSATGGTCLLYTSPSPRDRQKSRMPSSA